MRLPPRSTGGARGGFTLLEVVVALVVLSIGLLGVAGMITTSAHTLASARSLARTVAVVEEVADSLALFGVTGEGELASGPVRVTWEVEEGDVLALVRIRGRAGAGGIGVRVSALLPGAPP